MKLPRWIPRITITRIPPPAAQAPKSLDEATAYVTDMLAKFLDSIELAARPADSRAQAKADLEEAGRLLSGVIDSPGSNTLLAPIAAMMQNLIMHFHHAGVPYEVWMAELRRQAARGIDGAEQIARERGLLP